MRVLISTNIPSPYRWLFWNQLSEKCDLSVVFESRRAKDRNESWYPDTPAKFHDIFLNGLRYGQESAASFGLVKYFLSRKYDVKVLGGYSSLSDMLTILVLKLCRIKYILDIDGAIEQEESALKRSIKGFFIRGADFYLSPSERSDQYLMKYGVRQSQLRRFRFTSLLQEDISNAPSTEAEKQALREQLHMTEEKVVLSVGSFIHRKGFDVLLESFSGMPETVGCYLVGGVPTPEYLSMVEKQGLKNIHFIDHTSKEELLKYYRAADCLAFPTRYDIWGLVVNEALSRGLPVITTDRCVSGLELIQQGKNGFLIPSEDPSALREKILCILQNDALQAEMSENALKTAGEYTIENMVEEYLSVFHEFTGQSENAANR